MTIRRKFIISALVAFLALILTVWGLSTLLTQRVNAYVMNLAEKMTTEIGHPVLIDKVQIKWDWLLLKVNIKNLKILDKDTNAPLFMAGEIISTVDTLDSIRTLSLKFKQLLLRNPRLVMQLNPQYLPVISGLGDADVAGDINPEVILKILSQQRRIIVENGDVHLQGADGADLPFMDLRIDFKRIAEQEYSMMLRGNIAAAVQPEFVFAMHYYGELHDFEHAMLDFDLKTSNVQLDDLCNFIPQLRQDVISGNFTDLNINGVVQNGTMRQVATDFTINKISVGNDTHIVGGIGHIDYSPGTNVTALQLAHINITNEKLYAQPITIDSISTDVVYAMQSDSLDIHTENARVKFMDLELHPQLQLQFVSSTLQNLEFALVPVDAAIRRMLALLPDRMLTTNLSEWFKRSLIEGEINLVNISYKDQKLRYALGFKDAELKFAPLWPSIHSIDAMLMLDDGQLSVNATKAIIMNTPLKRLETKYNDYQGKPYMLISVDGAIETNLTTTLNYLQQTPLQETLATKLAALDPNGQIDLTLHLDVNLALQQVTVGVEGLATLRDTSIKIENVNMPINNINGVLSFNNSSFAAEKLNLNIFDEPAIAKIGMHATKANILNIVVDTPFKISALKQVLPKLDLGKIKGATHLQATLELPWGDDKQQRVLTIKSDLQGITSKYPAPFNKEAHAKLPLNLRYLIRDTGNDKVQINISNLIDGVLFIKESKLQGGKIAINKKLAVGNEMPPNLVLNGDIKHLIWEEWAPLLQAKDDAAQLPIELDFNINKLTFSGEDYTPVHIKYNTTNSELFVDTTLLTGTIVANMDVEQKIDIKLERLNVPENRVKSNTLLDNLRAKRDKEQLPLIQFSCKTMHFNKRMFKNIRLDLLPRTYGYEITNFSITNDNLMLQAQGNWQMDGKSLTSLSGNIYTQNFGKVLTEWGYENSISKGKGEMNFAINWEGGPMDFDLLRIAGGSHLDLRSGSLTNVNPGIGRIIGLLSLESIHRRLQLDFSDIISKGFAFDKLVADFKIEPGSVMSDNILINSPSAKIELNGKTGIKSQDLDFTMFVTPKVGASLPIAAAIAAGNPAVGAAIWLFDKASGSKISEITKYKYKVTGTWNSPEVNEVSNQNKVVG